MLKSKTNFKILITLEEDETVAGNSLDRTHGASSEEEDGSSDKIVTGVINAAANSQENGIMLSSNEFDICLRLEQEMDGSHMVYSSLLRAHWWDFNIRWL